jgi:CRISPR system Cascade subunit CasD
MTEANTVFLRLEGSLQSWGDTSKFVIRRTMDAPTKSGVLGLLCCAMGLSREAARERLPELNGLAMGVRIDRHGTRWWDYHTVGAGIGMTTAGGGLKTGAQGTLVTRREYLADASFLVALQGDAKLIKNIAGALGSPKWPLFLGRKSCPPAVPILLMRKRDSSVAPEAWEPLIERHDDLAAALRSQPWRARIDGGPDHAPADGAVTCLAEWQVRPGVDAPPEAEVWYDNPVSFDPPVHKPRLVLRQRVQIAVAQPLQRHTPPPPRPRAAYQNSEYRNRRAARLAADQALCVFCKNPATTVQHVTYRHAGGSETQADLRSLCRLCHDAVTMIEYGLGMGLDRINPEDARWRDAILRTRGGIIAFRSEEGRRRALRQAPEQVRRELLEEEAS